LREDSPPIEESPTMRLLVLQSCPLTPAGIVAEAALAEGAELEIRFPHDGAPVPASLAQEGFDGLILPGGPMHAGDDANFPAFARVLDLIRTAHDEDRPVMGLCLGGQLIARAFGKPVYPWGGLEIGYTELTVTPEGRADPLFKGLAPRPRLMQFHADVFEVPDGAELLMTGPNCPNQAFRLGRATYGFQCHPEATQKDATSFPRDCWAAMQRHFGPKAEAEEARVKAEVDRYWQAGAEFCREITRRWLKLAVE
jgi:GMP synthase (glutamine-hydrolysing)